MKYGTKYRAAIALTGFILLTGCGSSDAPPLRHDFPPPSYAYLRKFRLNVRNLRIDDRSPPPGLGELAQEANPVPAYALTQMARERILAAGNSGTAIFVIDLASITRDGNGTFNGMLAVHIDILGDDGAPRSFAQARVTRPHVPANDEDDVTALHALVTDMMADMNIELEFQLRQNLRDLLLRDGTTPAAVRAEPLAPPPAATPPMTPPAASDAPPLSPPPGVLKLPGT
jgi:hypothetical protein